MRRVDRRVVTQRHHRRQFCSRAPTTLALQWMLLAVAGPSRGDIQQLLEGCCSRIPLPTANPPPDWRSEPATVPSRSEEDSPLSIMYLVDCSPPKRARLLPRIGWQGSTTHRSTERRRPVAHAVEILRGDPPSLGFFDARRARGD